MGLKAACFVRGFRVNSRLRPDSFFFWLGVLRFDELMISDAEGFVVEDLAPYQLRPVHCGTHLIEDALPMVK